MAVISTTGEDFAFAAALVRAGYLDTPLLVLDHFEKPWNWAPEFELWEGCGRPSVARAGGVARGGGGSDRASTPISR